MKIAVCGKGGSGKSTISALLAKSMAKRGYNVLVVDIDESNYGLQSQLGMEFPEDLMSYMGGKSEYGRKMQSVREQQIKSVFDSKWHIDDIPEGIVARKDGISLLAIGKIQSFGEGCACALGSLSKQFFENLVLKDNDVLIVDTEAGIEHLGRSIEKGFDTVLIVVDPSYESIKLSGKIEDIAKDSVGSVYIVLNKVREDIKDALTGSLQKEKIAAVVPDNSHVFSRSLAGKELDTEIDEINELAVALISRKAINV